METNNAPASFLDVEININVDGSSSNDDSWRWETTRYPEMPKPVNFGSPPKFPARQVTLTSSEISASNSSRNLVSKTNDIIISSSLPRGVPGQTRERNEIEKEMNLKSTLTSAAIPKQPRRQVSLTVSKCPVVSSIVPPKFPQRQESLVLGGINDDFSVTHHKMNMFNDKQPISPYHHLSMDGSDFKAIDIAKMNLLDDVSILSENCGIFDNSGGATEEVDVSSKRSGRQARLITNQMSDDSPQQVLLPCSIMNDVEDKKPTCPRRRESNTFCAATDCCRDCLNSQVLVCDNKKLFLLSGKLSSLGKAEKAAGRAASVPPTFPQRQVSNITYEEDKQSNIRPTVYHDGDSHAEETHVTEVCSSGNPTPTDPSHDMKSSHVHRSTFQPQLSQRNAEKRSTGLAMVRAT